MRHRNSVRATAAAFALGTVVLTTACAHYKVTNTTTGAVHYTKHLNKRTGGAVTFKDAKTGEKVTLDSFSREKISGKEFKEATQGG